MTLASRKHHELRRKLALLDEELEHWKLASAAGGTLEKHHTQVRLLAKELLVGSKVLAARLDAAATSGRLVAESRRFEERIALLFRAWGWYRSKLSLRALPWLDPFLSVADELAWGCMAPVLRSRRDDAAFSRAQRRAPPLCFLADDHSAFAGPQGASAAEVDPSGGDDSFAAGARADAPLRRVLDALPLSVIGIPWTQLAWPPDLAFVAHEAGHLIEDDLGLGARLENLVEAGLDDGAVPAARRVAWRMWRGELFADLVGCLVLGPAYGWASLALLAGSQRHVRRERWDAASPESASYPTAALQMAAIVCAIRVSGFDADATALDAEWRARHPAHGMPEFEPDLAPLVRRVVEGPWPELRGDSLRTLIALGPAGHGQAVAKAASLRDGYDLGDDATVAVLAAAGVLATRVDAALFDRPDRRERLLAAMRESVASGVRAGEDDGEGGLDGLGDGTGGGRSRPGAEVRLIAALE